MDHATLPADAAEPHAPAAIARPGFVSEIGSRLPAPEARAAAIGPLAAAGRAMEAAASERMGMLAMFAIGADRLAHAHGRATLHYVEAAGAHLRAAHERAASANRVA